MQQVGVEVVAVRQLASPDTDLLPVLAAAVGDSDSRPSVAAVRWSCTPGVTRLVESCLPVGH